MKNHVRVTGKSSGKRAGAAAHRLTALTGGCFAALIALAIVLGLGFQTANAAPNAPTGFRVGLQKEVAADPDGYRLVGDSVVFTITVSNDDLYLNLILLPLRDEYDPAYLDFVSASPPPTTSTVPGVLEWADLTLPPGADLAPGEQTTGVVTFTALARVAPTINSASVTGAYFSGPPFPESAGPVEAPVDIDELDFGDAPDPTYPTLLASNGARHFLETGVSGLKMGSQIDGETDGQPHAAALGDDLAGVPDDEVGVAFVTPIIPGMPFTYTVVASAPGVLNAWIDFAGDGAWGVGDQIATNLALVAGTNTLILVAPSSAVPGSTFARFRFSSASGLQPTGFATDGEVEDYEVEIVQPDLTIDKDDGSATTVPGGTVSYTLT